MSNEIEAVSRLIWEKLGSRAWCILEAGCGSASHLSIPDDATLVGIDISNRQLSRNTRLNEAIVGDIQVFPLPNESFDLVVCWDVLEHLPDPEKALFNLFEAARPGGLVLLAFPNLLSLKGLVTRFTPFFVHLWFYRYIIGDHRDPKDMDQFPTYLRWAMTPANVTELARTRGLHVSFFLRYEGPVLCYLRSRHRLAGIVLDGFERFCRVLTFGRWNPNLSDCLILLEKPMSKALTSAQEIG